MAPAPETAKPVTLNDLEGPVRELLGLTIAMYCAIEGTHRHALDEGEARAAFTALAGVVAEQARDLQKLWEQAFEDQARARPRA